MNGVGGGVGGLVAGGIMSLVKERSVLSGFRLTPDGVYP